MTAIFQLNTEALVSLVSNSPIQVAPFHLVPDAIDLKLSNNSIAIDLKLSNNSIVPLKPFILLGASVLES
jgi:hypothetical protein